ncbi:hypothetical protein [Myroides odoratus]|uniref:Uncharacterized protein n=1 Tax=Myroides odoratus TaxID=256 RepID=A0A378RJ28_MYROD|nr:hypothetical protein [Myroides odoratus]QQU02115.1 hypothetical protein I6I89_09545 [Myroides odoratus]STZ26984.1 Uncharacterised protein [Myroides odoratus]
MKTLLTRKELYDLLWNTPLNKIADDYNLTIQQIKDSCNANNIPLPQVGYWSKLKYNKQPSIAVLDNSIPFDHIINLQDYTNKKTIHKSDILKSFKKTKKDSSLDVLIQNYKEKDRNKDQKSSTIIIHTSDQQKKRAVNFMNSFIKLMRKRGFNFIEKHGVIVIDFKGITMSFSIREHRNRIPTSKGPYYYDSIYKHSGRLIFSAGPSYRSKEWTDSKTTKLEDKILNIIQAIELMAQEEYQWNIKAEESRIRREIEQQKRIEIEKIEKQEQAKFNILLSESKDYQACLQIRAYIQAIEQKAILDNNLTLELINWLNWAKSKVDAMDPLVKFNLLEF